MPDKQWHDIEAHLGIIAIDCLDQGNPHGNRLVMAAEESHNDELWRTFEASFHYEPRASHE